jgi:hypothetical protein
MTRSEIPIGLKGLQVWRKRRAQLAKGSALDIPLGYGSQESEAEEVRMAVL